MANAEIIICRNYNAVKSCNGSERVDVLVGNNSFNKMYGFQSTIYIPTIFGNDYKFNIILVILLLAGQIRMFLTEWRKVVRMGSCGNDNINGDCAVNEVINNEGNDTISDGNPSDTLITVQSNHFNIGGLGIDEVVAAAEDDEFILGIGPRLNQITLKTLFTIETDRRTMDKYWIRRERSE